MAICAAAVTGFSGYGQAASHAAEGAAKQCDGTLPQRPARDASAHKLGTGAAATSEAEPAESGKAGDHLKLSTKAGEDEKVDAQGQFCRRERPSQDVLKPSTPTEQPEAASEPAPPIAQVEDGNLTIRANGEDFASVLAAVRAATGISVQMPGNSKAEPIFMNLGPVPIREALVALMDGTPYNYLLLGSGTDPQKVQELILSARPAVDQGALVASSGGVAATPQVTAYGAAGYRADPDADAAQEPVVPEQPMQPAEIPSSVPTGINIQQLAAQQNKTPGQILDELQKRQLDVLDQQAAAAQGQASPQ